MKIKVSDLWAEVKAVAAESPDYVYGDHPDNKGVEGCEYERNGKPSCIVGHAMYRLGITADKLAEFDDIGAVGPVVEGNPDLFDLADERTLHAIRVAQIRQDDDWTWGEAVAEGERKLAK